MQTAWRSVTDQAALAVTPRASPHERGSTVQSSAIFGASL
jgi:hypothetical protein